MAADVYSQPPHTGRGGWTWYTGSAGWIYRAALEYILGVKKAGDSLVISACIPPSWPGFEVSYKSGKTTYEIKVTNPEGVSRGLVTYCCVAANLERLCQNSVRIPLADSGGTKTIVITMGNSISTERPAAENADA